MDKIKTNNSGFVNFKNRNMGFKGDRGSWAKLTKDKVVVCRSKNGIVSDAYDDELREFCSNYGIEWDTIRCGDKIEKEIQ